jgi:hypothetical protein
MARSWSLTAEERRSYDADGYLIRPRQFSRSEVGEIAGACEDLVSDLVQDRNASWRMPMGSYVFEPDLLRYTTVKWEGDTDVVHGIEPCAHLSPALNDCAYDPRFIEPAIDMVGDPNPVLFTEKLNLKRPRHGGINPLHQDYPYWVGVAGDVEHVMTAILFLDDASLANGCIQVVPGSHRDGVWQGRTDGDEFLANEIDPGLEATVQLVPVEVEAGSLLFFGPYLVHKSLPNTSDLPRRALLYSYQPAGEPHMLEHLRRLITTGNA